MRSRPDGSAERYLSAASRAHGILGRRAECRAPLAAAGLAAGRVQGELARIGQELGSVAIKLGAGRNEIGERGNLMGLMSPGIKTIARARR